MMLQNRISGLPVIDAKGELVGVVTEGDFLRRREIGTERRRPKWLEFVLGPGKLAQEYVQTSGRKVAEIMTPNPWTVGEGRLAGGRGRSHGTPPHQAASGDPERADGRHRQPRQSDARAGEPVARPPGVLPAAIPRSATHVSPRSASSTGRRASMSSSRTASPSCGASSPMNASGRLLSLPPKT